MKIQIEVLNEDTDEVVVRAECLSFESAGEELGKLERFVQRKIAKDEQRAEDAKEEENE